MEKGKPKRSRLTKRKIAFVLFIGFLLIDVFGWFYSGVPTISIPAQIGHDINYWTTVAPPVFVVIDVWLSASGALSVNNPVHVRATVISANVSDLLRYYNGIAFTDAYESGTGQSQSPQITKIPLVASSKAGQYDADGTIVWSNEGPTWLYFLPNAQGNFVANRADVTHGDPVVLIASVSDTLSIQSTVTEQRLTWILVGFSVLMLQPVFEALLLRENPQQATQEKPQGLWHQYKQDRTSQSEPSQERPS